MLLGRGVMINWSNVAPEHRSAYYAWHCQEHMVGRLKIPGFLRGRRYIAHDARRNFLTVYEVLDLDVLTGADYLAKANAPSALTLSTTPFVTESMKEVVITLFEAMVLVMLVVYLFLQSWRATLIPMLVVPVSLVGTFAVFTALGFTINTLTLFAIVLATGIVVDDAIVVLENVTRHIEAGKTLFIKLVNIGAPDKDGRRTVTFELNGMTRETFITDRKVTPLSKARPKADLADPLQVAAPIPGLIATPMNANSTPERMKMLADKVPLGQRRGKPEEVSHVVLHLASDESAFTTGGEFVIDGGFSSQ